MWKLIKKILIGILVITIIGVITIFLLFKLTTDSMCLDTELKTIISPNKLHYATLIRGSCGAFDSYTYSIFITKKEKDYKNPIYIAKRVDDLNLTWINNKLFLISYKKADVLKFSNRWFDFDIKQDNSLYEIKILEQNKKYFEFKVQ